MTPEQQAVEDALTLADSTVPLSDHGGAIKTLAAEVRRLREVEAFANACCDKPEDRMWHAEDNTWWRRVKNHRGDHWVAADAPAGCETVARRESRLGQTDGR